MTPEPATVLPMTDLQPEAVAHLRRLGELAHDRCVGACVVGGVVRDLLLDRPAGDLDIVVEERAEDFAEAAVRKLGGTFKVYARFGTALLLIRGEAKVDVATARSESYAAPGALPNIQAGSISADLVRRDFTVNAMAASILPDDFGRLIDEHGGRIDLDAGVLRVLHAGSFTDDPTRILRAVRFQARFGFSIEPGTETLLHEAARSGALDTVSGERIMNELTLMLAETDPAPALIRLVTWKLTAAVRPCWAPDAARVERLLSGLATLPQRSPLTPLLALLASAAPSCRESVMDRLRASRELRDLVRDLERYEAHAADPIGAEADIKRSSVDALLRDHATEVLELAVAEAPDGRAADRIRLYTNELSRVKTELTGIDLIALGFSEGQGVGQMLNVLRRARLDGLVTCRREEETLALKHLAASGEGEGGT